MDDKYRVANEHARYYADLAIARFWHQARRVRGVVQVSAHIYPEEAHDSWSNPAGVVGFEEAYDDDPEGVFVWIDAERGLTTPAELYWLGYWDAENIHQKNAAKTPYFVTTNDVGALFGRFEGISGIGDLLMPFSCLGGIASPQDAINLFAGDQLHTMPYRDYLRTEHWQEMRGIAMEAADGRCQLCNSDTRLQTHHRTYIWRGFEFPGDLIVLCGNCHAKFHNKLPKGGD